MRLHLGDGLALPVAPADLAQAMFDGIAVGRQPERAAQQIHGHARATERARDVAEVMRLACVARDEFAEDLTSCCRLPAPLVVQRNIDAALEAPCRVPGSFAVPDVVDDWRRHLFCAIGYPADSYSSP